MRCPPDPGFLGVLPQKSEPVESAVEKVTSLAVPSTGRECTGVEQGKYP